MNVFFAGCFMVAGIYAILTSKRVASDGIRRSRKWFGADYGRGENYEAQGRVFIIVIGCLFIVFSVLFMLKALG